MTVGENANLRSDVKDVSSIFDHYRTSASGKGKSGGFRYMYYYIERDGQIFLLMVFNKDEQDNLTKNQKKTLSNLIRELREEGQ